MEFVAIVDLDAPPSPNRAIPIAESILTREEEALSASGPVDAEQLSLV